MEQTFSGNSFQKFRFTSREVVLFSGDLEIPEISCSIWHSRYESAPVPLVVKSYKMAASLSSQHYTGWKMICNSWSLFLIENENVRI